jgi:hypothetical protein
VLRKVDGEWQVDEAATAQRRKEAA